MRSVLFGPPGAGKGTIAGALVARTKAVHIATGDLLRAQMKEKTQLGERARSYIDKGELVPDELVIAMAEERLDQGDAAEGFILDGYPRTISQAEILDRFLSCRGHSLDGVFELQLAEDVIIRRLSGRRICPACETIYNVYTMPPKVEGKCDKCGAALITREDDNPKSIAIRFKAYQEQTAPLLDYYRPRGMLFAVDAGAGAERAAEQILGMLRGERKTAQAKG